MRVQYGTAMRPAPYDRDADTVEIIVDTGLVPPHSQTSRFTYLVPSGRKGIVESLQIYAKRGLSSSGISRAYVGVNIVRESTSRSVARLEFTETYSNAKDTLQLSNITLQEKESLQIVTYDYSTDGSVEYHAFGNMLIFRA